VCALRCGGGVSLFPAASAGSHVRAGGVCCGAADAARAQRHAH